MGKQLPYNPELLESLNKSIQAMLIATNRPMEHAKGAMAVIACIFEA